MALIQIIFEDHFIWIIAYLNVHAHRWVWKLKFNFSWQDTFLKKCNLEFLSKNRFYCCFEPRNTGKIFNVNDILLKKKKIFFILKFLPHFIAVRRSKKNAIIFVTFVTGWNILLGACSGIDQSNVATFREYLLISMIWATLDDYISKLLAQSLSVKCSQT